MTIDWGAWSEVGLWSQLQEQRPNKKQDLIEEISPDLGMLAFDYLLSMSSMSRSSGSMCGCF